MAKKNFLCLSAIISLFYVGSAMADESNQDQIYDTHSFERTVVKNRARLQEQSGAYKDTAVYKYCDDKEIERQLKEQKNSKGGKVDLCNVNVDKNTRQKKIQVAVDVNKEIVVDRAKQVNIGTIDSQGARNKDLSSFTNTRDIVVKGRYGN